MMCDVYKRKKRPKTDKESQHECPPRKGLRSGKKRNNGIIEDCQENLQNAKKKLFVNKIKKRHQLSGRNTSQLQHSANVTKRNHDLSKVVKVTIINEVTVPSVKFEIQEICTDTERKKRNKMSKKKKYNQNSKKLSKNNKTHPKILNNSKKSLEEHVLSKESNEMINPKSNIYRTSFLRIIKSNNGCSKSSDSEDEYETKSCIEVQITNNNVESSKLDNPQECENKGIDTLNLNESQQQPNPYSKFVQKMIYESLGLIQFNEKY